MRPLLTARRLAAVFTATALTLGLSTAGSAHPDKPEPAIDPTAPVVTVRPDPSYQGQAFEGWGTSLVWFANATGDYPPKVREKLADLVFGENGLNLNIARYNIGGGNAPDVPDYLRPGGAVEGWWQAPAGTTRKDVDWWDPDNPAHWNLDADQTQRWWIDRIKDDITHWETFSNSPPWFQTNSGYVSGGLDANQDQIRSATVDDFATYLARVTEELEDAHGITVDTIDPLNEPNTNYWGTRLGPDGNPVGGRQEGAHAGPALQQQVIRALAAKLTELGSDTTISAMDETNPGTFATNWNAYPQDVRDLVSQLNVHTYGTGQRTAVRDIAKGEQKPLWMSEVEGSWGAGQSFTSMAPGLGMAQRIVDDLRELEPTAWVFWQPVEDYDNMKPGAEIPAGANWGSIQLPFNCTAKDTLKTCPIYTNTKFNTVRNFTHHIRPGDRLIKVGDTSSVAAVSTGKRATVVHVNDTKQARTVRLDLSAFRTIDSHATVTPIVTSADGALRKGAPIDAHHGTATLQVPAESVTTLLVKGVSGVASDAALAQSGHVYRLKGLQSNKSLTPAGTGSGTVIRTGDPTSAAQLWSLKKLTAGTSNRARYALTTAVGDRQLAVVDGAVTLVPAVKAPPANAQWTMSSTGDGTYTFVNVATKRLLEVGGQATQDGAGVSTWLANSGFNQRWYVIDETVLGIEPTDAFTVPGVAPVLPQTVVPVYRDGARGTLPVTWTLPSASAWTRPGTVQVSGVATDVLGGTHRAQATVAVDTLVSTRPGRAKTFVGGKPKLPATVTADGRNGTRVERPVVWQTPAAGAFDKLGVVTVAGQADAGDGRTLPATVRVQITRPIEAPAATTEVTATFTEPGYSPDGLRNGLLNDKAWSNWRSGTKNPSDTLTVALAEQQTVTRVVTHFYRDGFDSYSRILQVQARDAQGNWADAGGPVTVPVGPETAPAVEAVAPATTDAVRVVLTAHPDRHMTVSEIEVFASAPGTSSDPAAAGIALNGIALAGFSPNHTTYSVRVRGALPKVTAVAVDPYAKVEVRQPTARNRTATVTVTSEDGKQKRSYTIAMRK
jgi:O-glycosyl hydrolase